MMKLVNKNIFTFGAAVSISTIFSIALITMQYVWFSRLYPSYSMNLYIVLFVGITAISAVAYSILYVNNKKYFIKYAILKSIFFTLILYAVLHLTFHKIVTLDTLTTIAKNSCGNSVNTRDGEIIYDCLIYTGLWIFISFLILWLQIIVSVELLEKIGLLHSKANE